eukprot:365747-Chlamydomonas_euryale.AAC.27
MSDRTEHVFASAGVNPKAAATPLHGAGSPVHDGQRQEMDASDAEVERRRNALRSAGANILEVAMAQAQKGEDPFAVDPNRVRKERRKRQKAEDPEFVAFGTFLKQSLVYIYAAFYIIAQASSYVLVKVGGSASMTAMYLSFSGDCLTGSMPCGMPLHDIPCAW